MLGIFGIVQVAFAEFADHAAGGVADLCGEAFQRTEHVHVADQVGMFGSPAVQQRDDDVVPCRRRGGRIVLEIGFVEPDDCLSVLPQRVGERCDGVKKDFVEDINEYYYTRPRILTKKLK